MTARRVSIGAGLDGVEDCEDELLLDDDGDDGSGSDGAAGEAAGASAAAGAGGSFVSAPSEAAIGATGRQECKEYPTKHTNGGVGVHKRRREGKKVQPKVQGHGPRGPGGPGI